MKHLSVCVIVTGVLLIWLPGAYAATVNLFPEQLASLEEAIPGVYLTKVKEIPKPVWEALEESVAPREFKMADQGGTWNKTDYISNPSLPFRRLVWATQVKGFYIVHYEMGGIGHSTHYMIAGKNENGTKWTVLWSAAGFTIAKDYKAFISELKNGRLSADPRNIH